MDEATAAEFVQTLVDFEQNGTSTEELYALRLEFQRSVLLAEFFNELRLPNDRSIPILEPFRLQIILQVCHLMGNREYFKLETFGRLEVIIKGHIRLCHGATFHCYHCGWNMWVEEGSSYDTCNTCGGWFLLECPHVTDDEEDSDDDEEHVIDGLDNNDHDEHEHGSDDDDGSNQRGEPETDESSSEEEGVVIPALPGRITSDQIKNRLIPDNFPAEVTGIRPFDIKEGDEISCIICMTDIAKGGESASVIKCKHIFHTAEINEWFRSKLMCPICRTEFSYDDPLYRIYLKARRWRG